MLLSFTSFQTITLGLWRRFSLLAFSWFWSFIIFKITSGGINDSNNHRILEEWKLSDPVVNINVLSITLYNIGITFAKSTMAAII